MMSTLVNPQEHLEKRLKEHLKAPSLYMTTVTPEVIQQPLITSV